METAEEQFKGTKWNTPYQFLKVKMNAQQGKDSIAIVLLNELITKNKSESIKARARNIITEINNRKVTEAYLAALKIEKPTKLVNTNEEALELSKNPRIALKNDSSLNRFGTTNTMAPPVTKNDSAQTLEVTNLINFTNDSL
jgi:hydroxypyruvate isomerase